MSKVNYFVFLFLCQISMLIEMIRLNANEDLTSPYQQEILLPFDDHGWYGNAEMIEKIFQQYPIKVVVEIGSWLGKSTRHLASLVPEGGMVYAIDHWKGSSEHQNGVESKFLPYLYEQFISNIIHAELTHKITPMRMSSLEAARIFNKIPDLIYLDGSHEYDAVYQDLKAWFPFVKGHGILCGDDWWWGTTREAIVQFAKENNLCIFAEGNFWRYIER